MALIRTLIFGRKLISANKNSNKIKILTLKIMSGIWKIIQTNLLLFI